MPSHTSIELKYLNYDGAKVVLTSQAPTAAVLILRNEDTLWRVNSDGMIRTPTLMKMH